jgi:nicotinamide-nucleotide amidase
MNRASIVSVGNEILAGWTVDTNAAYLCGELLKVGIPVVSTYTVGDEIEQIVQKLEQAGADAEVILVTGGLGPTDDDLTRQAFAEFLGVELQFQEELLEQIKKRFAFLNVRMPEKNRIQANIPAGAKALRNNHGTAPGIMAEKTCPGPATGEHSRRNGWLLFALPGVPPEMKRMFTESVLPEIQRFGGGQTVVVRKLKCFGAGESTIAEMLGELMQRGRNPLINCTAGHGVITLHIIAASQSKETAEKLADKDEKLLREMLGELLYGTGEQSLAEVVAEKLSRQQKTVATAESCTGGCLAGALTDVPGASEYFKYGWIAYCNEAKISELGVAADLIGEYGAVSEQVAEAMAKGARRKADTDFAIGITGIAGPTGGTGQKPVGLVYISVDYEEGCETKRCFFSKDRQSVRLRTTQTALNMLRLKLNI